MINLYRYPDVDDGIVGDDDSTREITYPPQGRYYFDSLNAIRTYGMAAHLADKIDTTQRERTRAAINAALASIDAMMDRRDARLNAKREG